MNRSPISAQTDSVVSLDNERLALRLGEMVVGLTDCDRGTADDAVRAVLASDPRLDALEVVARATIVVATPAHREREVPEPAPRRVVVDLRDGPARVHLDLA